MEMSTIRLRPLQSAAQIGQFHCIFYTFHSIYHTFFGPYYYRVSFIYPCLLTNYKKLSPNYSAFIFCEVPNDGKFVANTLGLYVLRFIDNFLNLINPMEANC